LVNHFQVFPAIPIIMASVQNLIDENLRNNCKIILIGAAHQSSTFLCLCALPENGQNKECTSFKPKECVKRFFV